MFVGSSLLFAGDQVTVTATVDRNQMRPGDTFTYSISITSEGSVSVEQPQLPDVSAFDLINSWSGSEMRGVFTNGQVQTQRSQTYNYQFVANREGQFTIGAAQVQAGGQTLNTNPITITVNAASAQGPTQGSNPGQQRRRALPQAPQDQQGQPEDDDEDMFTQLLQRRMRQFGGGARPTPGLARGNPDDVFFVRAEADKRKMYAGEQVTVGFYLVTRGQIMDIDTLKYPDLKGFWKEDIEIATRLNFQPEVINGIAYQRALLASYALFPISPGKSQIDSYRAKCKVMVANQLGMPSSAEVVKESEAIPIEVLPLPEANKPANFSGGVGEFTVSGQIDNPHVKAGQPVTLKVRIDGKGNAKVIDFPKLDLGSNVQVYDPKINMKFFANGRSFKEFETLIVSRAPGELKIPAISFWFFNPETKNYVEGRTTELTVQVDPSDGTNSITAQKLESPTIAKAAEPKAATLPDLVFASERPASLSTQQQLGAWAALFLLTILSLWGYGWKLFRSKEKREDLRQKIDRRLKEIESSLDAGRWREVGVHATELISFMLGEIAGLGGASFEFDKLIDKAPPSFKRELAGPLNVLMQKLAVVAYAPDAVVGALREKPNLKKLLSETRQLLGRAAEYDFSVASENK